MYYDGYIRRPRDENYYFTDQDEHRRDDNLKTHNDEEYIEDSDEYENYGRHGKTRVRKQHVHVLVKHW